MAKEKIDLTKRVYTILGESIFFTSRLLAIKYAAKKIGITEEDMNSKFTEGSVLNPGDTFEDGMDILTFRISDKEIVIREYILLSEDNEKDFEIISKIKIG